MTILSIQRFIPQCGDAFYVETSALLAVAYTEAARKGATVPQQELSRGHAVAAFLKQVKVQGAKANTSVLAFEELAGVVRNKIRADRVKSAGKSNWRDWRNEDQQAAEAADANAHSIMLTMLQYAAVGIGDELVQLVWPDDSFPPRTIRKKHRELMRQWPMVDPMDALHIIVGTATGAKRFLTFDKAWASCTNIDIVSF